MMVPIIDFIFSALRAAARRPSGAARVRRRCEVKNTVGAEISLCWCRRGKERRRRGGAHDQGKDHECDVDDGCSLHAAAAALSAARALGARAAPRRGERSGFGARQAGFVGHVLELLFWPAEEHCGGHRHNVPESEENRPGNRVEEHEPGLRVQGGGGSGRVGDRRRRRG